MQQSGPLHASNDICPVSIWLPAWLGPALLRKRPYTVLPKHARIRCSRHGGIEVYRSVGSRGEEAFHPITRSEPRPTSQKDDNKEALARTELLQLHEELGMRGRLSSLTPRVPLKEGLPHAETLAICKGTKHKSGRLTTFAAASVRGLSICRSECHLRGKDV